jgi:hypothetical protein
LQVEAGQAETTAGQVRRGVATVRAGQEAGARLSATYDRLAQVRIVTADTADAGAAVNSLGQVTGQVVSVAA